MCLTREPSKIYIRGKSCHKSQTAVAVAVAETAALDCIHMVMSFRFTGV